MSFSAAAAPASAALGAAPAPGPASHLSRAHANRRQALREARVRRRRETLQNANAATRSSVKTDLHTFSSLSGKQRNAVKIMNHHETYRAVRKQNKPNEQIGA